MAEAAEATNEEPPGDNANPDHRSVLESECANENTKTWTAEQSEKISVRHENEGRATCGNRRMEDMNTNSRFTQGMNKVSHVNENTENKESGNKDIIKN